jgi:hypothetical protein
MSTFRNAANARASAGSASSQAEQEKYAHMAGIGEVAPGLKFGIGLLGFIFGLGANFIEVTTTVIGFIASGQKDLRFETIDHIAHTTSYLFIICLMVAFAIQFGMHMKAPAMMSVWTRLKHIKTNTGANLAAHPKNLKGYVTIQNIVFALCLLLNIIGDGAFVTLYTSHPALIAAWVILLPYFSTFGWYSAWNLMWGDIQDFKDFRLHRMQYWADLERKAKAQEKES